MSEFLPHVLTRRSLWLILIAAWLPMFWLTQADFAFDDRAQLFANAAVQQSDWKLAWTKGWWANVAGASETFVAGGDLWRPLTTCTLIVSHALYGESPFGYHVENLLLHGLACVCVWRLLLAWRFSASVALLATCFFALAPIAIEAVASIAQRAELLAAVGAACALRWHALDRTRLACLALLCALLSKEGAIVLPLLALLADRCLLERRDRGVAFVKRYAPLLCATAIYFAARYAVLGRVDLGGSDRATYYTASEWPLRAWLTQAELFWSQILPATLAGIPLVFDWSRASRPTAALDSTSAWIAFVVLLISAVALLWFARRHPRAGFGPLFFGLAYLPTANLLLPIGVLFAPRLLYWPHLGSSLAIAWVLHWLYVRKGWSQTLLARLAMLFLVLLSIRTVERTLLWQSAERLYSETLEQVPDNALVHLWRAQETLNFSAATLAAAEDATRRYEFALSDIEAALRSDPHLLGGQSDLLIRTAWSCDQVARALIAIDRALRLIDPARPMPSLPALAALQQEPLSAEAIAALSSWGRAVAEAVPPGGELALIGIAATLLPDYLDARAMSQPLSDLLDRRAKNSTAWTPEMQTLLTQISTEMRASLLRSKNRIDVLWPIANTTARSALLEPLRARVGTWLQVLESALR